MENKELKLLPQEQLYTKVGFREEGQRDGWVDRQINRLREGER